MLIHSNHTVLPRGSIGFALGIAGMLVSLYYSIVFIAGNSTGIELIIGIVFALTLDYGKVALATETLYALASFRLISAVVYGLIVVSLYCLSMLAATFVLTSHNANVIAEQHDSRVTSIQQEITAKRAELAACQPGIMTKCINPRTKELTALQTELVAAQNVSLDVIDAKNRAATWDKVAKTLGSTSDKLQVKLAFARAVLLEIIAPIYVSIFLAVYRNRQPVTTHEKTVSQPEPATEPQPTTQAAIPQQPTQPSLPNLNYTLKW